MKKFLLIGTALLSVASYASDMKQNQRLLTQENLEPIIKNINQYVNDWQNIQSNFFVRYEIIAPLQEKHAGTLQDLLDPIMKWIKRKQESLALENMGDSVNKRHLSLMQGKLDQIKQHLENYIKKSLVTSEDWNDIWSSLWNPEVTKKEYETKLQYYYTVDSKTAITPLERENNLKILKNLWDNTQLDFEQLDYKIHIFSSLRFQNFESIAAEIIEQFYNDFHSRISEDLKNQNIKLSPQLSELLLSNKEKKEEDLDTYEAFMFDSLKSLFRILIKNQRAQITSDLASKLLRDQEYSFLDKIYTDLDLIGYLIAKEKGSLVDLLDFQRETSINYDTLKTIIISVMTYQREELHPLDNVDYKTKEEIVKEKVSIFQRNIIEPLQKAEICKEILFLSGVPPLKETVEAHESYWENLATNHETMRNGYKEFKGLESIEYLYYQELNKLFESSLTVEESMLGQHH